MPNYDSNIDNGPIKRVLAVDANGDAVSSGGGYTYTLTGQCGSTTFTDGSTFYMGLSFDQVADSQTTRHRIFVPVSGTVKLVSVTANTVGTTTTDTIPTTLLINGSTAVSIGNLSIASASTYLSATPDTSVTAGDYLQIRLVCPTFGTDPSNTRLHVTIVIQPS